MSADMKCRLSIRKQEEHAAQDNVAPNPKMYCVPGIELLDVFNATNIEDWRAQHVQEKESHEQAVNIDDLLRISHDGLGSDAHQSTASNHSMPSTATWNELLLFKGPRGESY